MPNDRQYFAKLDVTNRKSLLPRALSLLLDILTLKMPQKKKKKQTKKKKKKKTNKKKKKKKPHLPTF